MSTNAELCQKLAETRKSYIYPLIDRLIRLVLTLPMTMTTTKWAFSSTKIIKTTLQNKIKDDFLADYMIIYNEKEIAAKFASDMIIDNIYSMKHHRVQLKKVKILYIKVCS